MSLPVKMCPNFDFENRSKKRSTNTFFLYWDKKGYGYTFVELLVVIATMVILFGVGYANLRDYQKRQYLESARRMVVSDLKLAQEYALAGKGCTSVLEYYSFIIPSPSSYNIRVKCDNSPQPQLVKEVNMPQGIQISGFAPPPNLNDTDLRFYPLGKGTNIVRDAVVSITLTFEPGSFSSFSTIITVTPGGTIK